MILNNNERNGIFVVCKEMMRSYIRSRIVWKRKTTKIAKVSLSDTNSEKKENTKRILEKKEETMDDYAQISGYYYRSTSYGTLFLR